MVIIILITVIPRKPTDVYMKYSGKSRSVDISWEQVYDSDEEKPIKYHVKVANRPELCQMIEHTFGGTSPCLCKYTLTGLQPGQTYTVIITAENGGGYVDSDEFLLQTSGKPHTKY